MRSRLLILLPLFACAIPCIAQTAIKVTPCELIASPEKYAGKVVQVRARVDLAFEDFSLAQPGCEDKSPGVWLIYGGDEPTPTASTWNDVSRKPGSVVTIDGIPVPLVHDASLDLFKKRLAAIRLGMIGGTKCYYDCHLYNVTATLTGLFFAAMDTAQQHRGYGHLGCCHLLAIEKVADVAAERSSIPTGAIRCSTDSKDLTLRDAKRLYSMSTSCESLSRSECSAMSFRQMEAVAALWGDSLDINTGHLDGGEISGNTETSEWITLDRLKHYELSIRSEKPGEDQNVVYGGTATRVSCKEVSPPPDSEIENQTCRNIKKKLRSTPVDGKFNPSHLGPDLNDRPAEMQRLEDQAAAKIDIAAKELGLSIKPGARTVTCDPLLVYRRKEFGSCSWNNDTGTILIGVNLIRPWLPKKNAGHDETPWVLTNAEAHVCEVEK